MIISIDAPRYNRKSTIEIDVDSDIFDVIEDLCGLLVAHGYHPNSVKSGILAQAEEYNNEDSLTPSNSENNLEDQVIFPNT